MKIIIKIRKDILDIINSFKPEYDIKVKMIKYFEYIDEKYVKESKIKQRLFNESIDSMYGKDTRLNHLHGYNHFTIEYIYRKYLLHLLSITVFIHIYEFIINARIFEFHLIL